VTEARAQTTTRVHRDMMQPVLNDFVTSPLDLA
jgi:hypothetical protein